MSKSLVFVVLAVFIAIFFTACKKDDPIIPNEEELISTLKYTLTSIDGEENIVLTFQDLDGDGGSEPIIIGGTLFANQSYTGTLALLNEVESPIVSISDEVAEEAEEHQFFFQTDLTDVVISYADQDSQGDPIGLKTVLTTGGVASGSLTIILRHELDKTAAGVSNGDITNAGGETDIEVTFPIDVQ